ncbi:MAG: VWA domain-containing protein [Vicinamibacterales bacterium]
MAITIAVAGARAGTAPQQATFRGDVQTVAVYATVRGPDGRLVTSLGRDDFRILEDGRPTEITVFSNEVQPITVAALLDTSDSMGGEIARVKAAAGPFIDALLPADRVRFGTFGREIALSPLLTGDKAVLRRVVREEIWPVEHSPVWTALEAAMRSLEAEAGRRVVLTLSDGEDRCSDRLSFRCVSLDEVRERAVGDGFMVYAVDVQGAGAGRSLRRLAEDTGGGHYALRRDADLGRAFADIVDELHHQYLLGFVPAALDGREHAIEVQVAGGLTARARRSYVARGRH